jgi:hypothetical protein
MLQAADVATYLTRCRATRRAVGTIFDLAIIPEG